MQASIIQFDGPGPVTFVTGSDRWHVSDVLAQFPAGPDHRGKLALVDDLFGSIDGVLRCGLHAPSGLYFWQPNGMPESDPATMPTTGDMVLTALLSPTAVMLSGSIALGVTRKVTLSTANVWPGARKKITTRGVVSLLGTLQVLSGLNSLLNLTAGNEADFMCNFAGGTPTWERV